MSPKNQDKLDIVTFGCRLNSYESEVIRKTATEDGLSNAIIFNTCAVTGEAVRQARQAIRRARKENPDARLVVTGCAAQTDPDTFAQMAEVDFVIGNADKQKKGAYALTPDSARVVATRFSSAKPAPEGACILSPRTHQPPSGPRPSSKAQKCRKWPPAGTAPATGRRYSGLDPISEGGSRPCATRRFSP